jgi:hypothetical protein
MFGQFLCLFPASENENCNQHNNEDYDKYSKTHTCLENSTYNFTGGKQ